MIGLQRRSRDRGGPAKELLGFDWLARDFTHDAEVVQRIGELRIERSETGFQEKGGLTEKLLR